MQRLLKAPLIFFFLAASIGLLLRWYGYRPLDIEYTYWLHAHSHVMFLGWVFNALTIGFAVRFIPAVRHPLYVRLLITSNVMIAGMLVAFPLQGYALYSIAFSTLHTAVMVVYTYFFFKDTRTRTDHASRMAKASLVFFLISSAGVFAVGALSANGLGKSDWYYLAVYYYLHFQYNGVFIFGTLALIMDLFHTRLITFPDKDTRLFGWLLFLSCFPAYFLSTLWAQPPVILNWIGLIAATIQVAALFFFVRMLRAVRIGEAISPRSKALLLLVLTAFVLKIFLQLISAHPDIARMAYEMRSLVIAYLHLVLIGVITLSLLVWYHEQQGLRIRTLYLALLVVGFLISQSILVGSGFFLMREGAMWMVICSTLMTAAVGGVVADAIRGTGFRVA